MANRYYGFPKLFEFLQGVLWKITGSFHSVVIPQMIALAGFVFAVQRRLGVSPTLTLAAFCMSPLLIIHAVATNNDLFAGILIAWGLVIVMEIVAGPEDLTTSSWLQLVVLFALASATKFQATLVVSAVLALLIVTLAVQRRLKPGYFGWLVVAVISVNAWEIRNLIAHGNPFYPVTVNLAGHVLFAGPEPDYSLRPQYGPHIGAFYFLTSLTEFDWVKRGVVALYSLSMETGDSARTFGVGRTGGFGQAYVIASLSLIIAQFVFWKSLDRKQKILVWMFAASLVITSLMPQAHELRYWLYLPLFWNVVTLRFLGLVGAGFGGTLAIAIPFVAMGIGSSVGYIWDARYVDSKPPVQYTNSDPNVITVEYAKNIEFAFSRAMTGQNVILFCKKDPLHSGN